MAVDPNAQTYEQEAATGTGIPFSVTHQQAIAESGETDSPVSSAGARGFWQFLPSTYNANAAKAGVPPGSWNNPADATKVYIVYMNELLKQEGGNIFKALEAYNAGPNNLSAGASYASGIEAKAGVPQSATAGNPVQTTAADIGIPTPFGTIPIPGTGGIDSFFNSIGKFLDPATWIGDISKSFLGAFGISSLKDLMQRLALILFGAILVIVGIRMLSSSSSNKNNNIAAPQPNKSESVPKESGLAKGGESAEVGNLGTSEALEAAAVA